LGVQRKAKAIEARQGRRGGGRGHRSKFGTEMPLLLYVFIVLSAMPLESLVNILIGLSAHMADQGTK
jgi:hypothetical protein